MTGSEHTAVQDEMILQKAENNCVLVDRSMVFSPNDSPLAGREGTHLTGSKIGERLAAEAATSVSLRVVPVDGGGEAFEVQARGELQLGLLIGECTLNPYSATRPCAPPAVFTNICCSEEFQHAAAAFKNMCAILSCEHKIVAKLCWWIDPKLVWHFSASLHGSMICVQDQRAK